MKSFIHQRMPVILRPEDETAWMETEPSETKPLLERLQPLPANKMEMSPVSNLVNWAKNDSPKLIERITDTQQQFELLG